MATAELFPIYTKLSQKILRRTRRQRETSGYSEVGSYQIVAGLCLFWLALRCPTHAWTWPRANNEEHFEGFDAHQTCHKCMSRRMFDTRKWQAGLVYRHTIRPEAASEACSASFGKKAEPSASGYFVAWIRSWTT
ncbi:MAG: hypothetical protein WA354_25245 [Terracidiphilus sp.]